MFDIPILTLLKIPLMISCFGGSTKMPEMKSAPAPEPLPTPTPAPTPTVVEPTQVQSQTAEKKRKQIQMLRYGMLSTIRSSRTAAPAPDIYTPAAGGLKSKMGE